MTLKDSRGRGGSIRKIPPFMVKKNRPAPTNADYSRRIPESPFKLEWNEYECGKLENEYLKNMGSNKYA